MIVLTGQRQDTLRTAMPTHQRRETDAQHISQHSLSWNSLEAETLQEVSMYSCLLAQRHESSQIVCQNSTFLLRGTRESC